MKRLSLFFLGLTITALQLSSCKAKKDTPTPDTNTPTQTTSPTTTPTAPVTVATDDALTTGVKDATKDFPGVTATVNAGEVTLSGTVQRDRLPVLMQSVQSLQPKKVINNLTIQ